ncbi:MAG: tRNA (N6-isopentenyl adenosine(37)-C2)-methylthiotransferase MiaB [Ruminococcus sp.]|nr:tRNA (N6-isopentenyl adenosine(37)-C2)-methylthiotransferase MiaB [Ruminococcus sp.]
MVVKPISSGIESFELSLLKNVISEKYKGRSPVCYLHSYGCQQNVSDGEKIKGELERAGFVFCEDEESADLIVLNTCAVRENAHERVYGKLGELKHLKERNKELVICVCGCMVQQEYVAEKIKETYPHVSLVFGTFALPSLHKMLYEVLAFRKRVFNISENDDPRIYEDVPMVRGSKFKAYVTVMYGCNNFCTYCIVPYVRGRERSREPEAVISEVRQLVREGYKEITLLGQNVNSYAYGFEKLLRALNDIEGDFWIRFMSSHPKDVSFELIDTIVDCEKVCTHLHLPVQSGNDEILKRMNRRYDTKKYLEIVDYARSRADGFSFSTDIIVGFPGESYEQFCDTKAFVRKVGYDNIYSFVYSKREGTRASKLEDNISSKQKGLWLRELLDEQRETVEKLFHRFVGRTLRVLVEEKSKKDGFLTGHSYENIIVEFEGDESLTGSFCNVKILDAMNWALKGKLIDQI